MAAYLQIFGCTRWQGAAGLCEHNTLPSDPLLLHTTHLHSCVMAGSTSWEVPLSKECSHLRSSRSNCPQVCVISCQFVKLVEFNMLFHLLPQLTQQFRVASKIMLYLPESHSLYIMLLSSPGWTSRSILNYIFHEQSLMCDSQAIQKVTHIQAWLGTRQSLPLLL